ncbi:hypothetical protein [Aureimonas sp. Leaf324]|uniref:hypothetical protein n=1 Tax=Aureimonas sp. Leaf324 TaxID=1736336 RepID=UPI0006F94889|nr:hypothetical protein [Aureimonas sp. Leaf324]KQQ80543.1 hypothetical protein ASF65_09935 [Aureimonas sp. Leaf324]
MFEEHTWYRERFDGRVQEALDLVKGRVLFLEESDGTRTHVLVPYIGWLAMQHLQVPKEEREEREIMMRLHDGSRELLIYIGTPPEAVTSALRAFHHE